MDFLRDTDRLLRHAGNRTAATLIAGGQTLWGVFDHNGRVAAVGAAGIVARDATFVADASQVPSDIHGRQLTLAGATWRVRQAVPAEPGLIELQLERP